MLGLTYANYERIENLLVDFHLVNSQGHKGFCLVTWNIYCLPKYWVGWHHWDVYIDYKLMQKMVIKSIE